MDEIRPDPEGEQTSLLRELLATSVGRRWLLKAGLGSAALVAAAHVPVWSVPSPALADEASPGGASTPVTLQFALGALYSSAASHTARDQGGSANQGLIFAQVMQPAAQDTATPSSNASPTARPSVTDTPTPQPSATPTAGSSASPTSTPTAGSSSTSATPTSTAESSTSPTPTAGSSVSPTPTATGSVTVTPSPGTPSGTPTAGASAGDVQDLTLIVNGTRLPLVLHTDDSRAALKAQGGLWAIMDLNALTHYVADVPLSSERAMLVTVQGTRGSTQVLVCQMFYGPADAVQSLAQLAASSGGLKDVVGSERRLQALGLTADQISTPEQVAQLQSIGDSHTTAAAFVMHHPNVATIDKVTWTATNALLLATPEVQSLGDTIYNLQHGQGVNIGTYVKATNPDGTLAQIRLTDNSTTPPTVITSNFTTIQFTQDDTFQAALKSGVGAGVLGVRDKGELGQVIDKPISDYPVGTPFKTWVQPQGVTPKLIPYAPPATAAGGGIQATVKNTGLLYGTYTQTTSDYSGGKVPIRIYNNWVRWMWAYVQYLGQNGDNLVIDSNAKWPSTRYSRSLVPVTQVATVLGVPLWDQNSVDVTLDFPSDAHTARLLYCGLGSNLNDGNWRQYFPSDAYTNPEVIAPTGEVLAPALVTGIVTIGLTVFTLAIDIAVSTVWLKARDIVKNILTTPNALEEIQAVFAASAALTAAETAAATVAAGGATYEDIASNDLKNIWSVLVSLASVIPKVLFSPAFLNTFWSDIGSYVTIAFGADKVLEGIPFLGEFVSVISVLGDVATLAEETAEAITAPWVIENEVNLTYQATVTINRDLAHHAATWPETARSWQLTANLGNKPMSDPLTGPLNPDGRVQSEAIMVTTSAPFGGDTIQWTFAVLDESGFQVGTGVSARLPNNDPSNPPTTVEFQITENPERVTPQTVFTRSDTVTYDNAATPAGYTWSEQVTDTGTVNSGGIQQVTGVTVSTTSGVVGVVWKQNDRYYLRGIPIAENGTSISMDATPKEGYARPPFLLFDPFVDRTDIGNHVLLEPDDSSDAYFIRKVTVGQDGSISWVPDSSLGMFTLPVSAAGLHSSGRIVAVHTDSGRFAWLQPVATTNPLGIAAPPPRPNWAAYSAGPGTQPGLLQSPIALAVTNPGTVLVLEAGAGKLAAFDLNGNPVKYFGTNQDQFTQQLASGGTYLDIAVDGAHQIYVLYYSGDGEQVEDYHIDVYTATGEPLVTNSPGTNVARFAVDYWRSIYGANFDPLTDRGTTTPHIDSALGVAEPSVSRFDPVMPA
ncbi:MAG: hypothetical protein JO057_30260 [Chloroflexi bacterium]|nr:hypothetical protein [Chloroflexota bacterium]